MLPFWIRLSNGNPIPRYFLATETTSLRFFSTMLAASFLVARTDFFAELDLLLRGSEAGPGLCASGTLPGVPASPISGLRDASSKRLSENAPFTFLIETLSTTRRASG